MSALRPGPEFPPVCLAPSWVGLRKMACADLGARVEAFGRNIVATCDPLDPDISDFSDRTLHLSK
jgi:hypothetical protein